MPGPAGTSANMASSSGLPAPSCANGRANLRYPSYTPPPTMARSRGGCGTCKKRHRKCDETRPSCRQCQASGLECAGYQKVLSWDVGVASRGRLRGAALPVQIRSRTAGDVSKMKSAARPPRTEQEPSRPLGPRRLVSTMDRPNTRPQPTDEPRSSLRDREHRSSWASFLPRDPSSHFREQAINTASPDNTPLSPELIDAAHASEGQRLLNECEILSSQSFPLGAGFRSASHLHAHLVQQPAWPGVTPILTMPI